MKTLIFIHGGESFKNDTDYQRFLGETYVNWQSEPWSPEVKTSWVQEIAKKWYGNGNQVFMPVFPNKLNARYEEWKIVFEGILSKLTSESELTFVGGSLGGCFLLKYFSEQNTQNRPFVIPSEAEESLSVPPYENELDMLSGVKEKGIRLGGGQKRIPINQIHLLAACISEGDFTPPNNYEYLQQLGSRVHIWHAEDDSVVPFSVGQEISKNLPKAETHFFPSEKGYGHFHGVERIPELEDILIKK